MQNAHDIQNTFKNNLVTGAIARMNANSVRIDVPKVSTKKEFVEREKKRKFVSATKRCAFNVASVFAGIGLLIMVCENEFLINKVYAYVNSILFLFFIHGLILNVITVLPVLNLVQNNL